MNFCICRDEPGYGEDMAGISIISGYTIGGKDMRREELLRGVRMKEGKGKWETLSSQKAAALTFSQLN